MSKDNLTVESLLQAQRKLYKSLPPIWYGTTDNIERGTCYIFYKGQLNEFFVLHPDDLPVIQQALPGLRLKHLSEKPIDAIAAIQARMRSWETVGIFEE